jgi:hypothetical protein
MCSLRYLNGRTLSPFPAEAGQEPDPAKLLQRIAEARSAVLDRIEDGFSKPSDGEQLAQRDALETLTTLRKIAERDTGE